MQELFHLYDLSIYTDVNNKTNNDYNESIKDGVHTLTKSAIDHANGCSPRQQQFIHSINMPDADNILIICGILDNISNNYIVKLKAYDKNAKQLDNKININELSMLSNEDDIEWWASISCTCDEENILPSQTYNQLRIQLQNEKHLINQLGNKYNAEDMVGLQSSYGKFIAGDIMSAFWPNMRYNKDLPHTDKTIALRPQKSWTKLKLRTQMQ